MLVGRHRSRLKFALENSGATHVVNAKEDDPVEIVKELTGATHPTLEKSIINKGLIKELNQHPDKYIDHDLHAATYPDCEIDVLAEQNLLESVDKVVLQFPFYWFNCPLLLKKWIDEVLSHGWVYGKNRGYKLEGKKFALAVSAGIKGEDGRHREISFCRWESMFGPLFLRCQPSVVPCVA